MKLRKLMAGMVAATMAVSTMAVGANAYIYQKEGATIDPGTSIATGMWLVQVFNTGNPDENKPAVDYGIDVESIDDIAFVVKAVETDDVLGYNPETDDGFGGGIVMSCNGGTLAADVSSAHNWVAKEWWGLEYNLDPDKFIQSVPNGNDTYTLEWKNISETENASFLKDAGCCQIALQEWGNPMTAELEVLGLVCKDASGNVVIAFDGLGNKVDEAAAAEILKGTYTAGAAADETTAAADETTAAADETTAAADKGENTTAGTATDKPNTNTGVEGVAVIAGLAVLATGAIVVSKKRK